MLLASSAFAVGVKVPVQMVLLSLAWLLVMVASVPDVVPLSRLGTVMSSALEKEATGSENSSDTVALSPALSAESESVKELTVGRRVSTSKFEVVTEVLGFPTWSVQLAASVIVLLSTSLSVVGVNLPFQGVLLSLSMGLIVASVPVALLRLMTSALDKQAAMEVALSG